MNPVVPESVQDLRLEAGDHRLFCSQRPQGEKALCKRWGRVAEALLSEGNLVHNCRREVRDSLKETKIRGQDEVKDSAGSLTLSGFEGRGNDQPLQGYI